MIKPIKVTVQESGAITFDEMEKLFEQVKKHVPSAEEIFESWVANWFAKEYPNVDKNDEEAMVYIIKRDKLEIIRNHDYTFGCILRHNIPVLSHGTYPSFKMNTNFYK